MRTVTATHRFCLYWLKAIEVNLEDWLNTHGEGYKRYTSTRIDPDSFEAILTVFIEDELFAMQFKLAWSEIIQTTI